MWNNSVCLRDIFKADKCGFFYQALPGNFRKQDVFREWDT